MIKKLLPLFILFTFTFSAYTVFAVTYGTTSGEGTPYVDKILFITQEADASATVSFWTHATGQAGTGRYEFEILLNNNPVPVFKDTFDVENAPTQEDVNIGFITAKPGKNHLTIRPTKAGGVGLSTSIYAFENTTSREINLTCGGVQPQPKENVIMTERFRTEGNINDPDDPSIRKYTEKVTVENPKTVEEIRAGTGFEYPINITYEYQIIDDNPNYKNINDNGYTGMDEMDSTRNRIEMLVKNIPETLEYEDSGENYHILYKKTKTTPEKAEDGIIKTDPEKKPLLFEIDEDAYYTEGNMPDGYVKDEDSCKDQFIYARDNPGGYIWTPTKPEWQSSSPTSIQNLVVTRTLYQSYVCWQEAIYRRTTTRYYVGTRDETKCVDATRDIIDWTKVLECNFAGGDYDWCVQEYTEEEGYRSCTTTTVKRVNTRPSEIQEVECENGRKCAAASTYDDGRSINIGFNKVIAYSDSQIGGISALYTGGADVCNGYGINLNNFSVGDTICISKSRWRDISSFGLCTPPPGLTYNTWGKWHKKEDDAIADPGFGAVGISSYDKYQMREDIQYKVQDKTEVDDEIQYYVSSDQTTTEIEAATWIEENEDLEDAPAESVSGFDTSPYGKWVKAPVDSTDKITRRICQYKRDNTAERIKYTIKQTVTYELPKVYVEDWTGDLYRSDTEDPYPREYVGRKLYTNFCETAGRKDFSVVGNKIGVNEYSLEITCNFVVSDKNNICPIDSTNPESTGVLGINQYFRPINLLDMFPGRNPGENWANTEDIIIAGEVQEGTKPENLIESINSLGYGVRNPETAMYTINLTRANGAIANLRAYNNIENAKCSGDTSTKEICGYLNYYKDGGSWGFYDTFNYAITK